MGTVGPLAGDGDLYAMQTAEMLLRHWDDPEGYTRAVLRKFRWMPKERQALERLLDGRMPTIPNMLTFKRHARPAGIELSAPSVISLFRKMPSSS